MSDVVGEAAARLEQAVEKLAAALSRPRAQPEGIPPERPAELSGRLDSTLARLRGALAELETADQAAPDPVPGGESPDEPDSLPADPGVESDAGSESPAPHRPAPPLDDKEH